MGSIGLLQAQTPERNVFFVHGLNGNAGSWVKYDEYFNSTRKANPIRHGYTEASGLTGAASDLRGQMAGSVVPNTYSQNIAIAHSQGGLVVRTIAKNYEGAQCPFGGFITVGTPNLGAKVVNSYKTGGFTTFTEDATKELMAGPGWSFFASINPFFTWIANQSIPKMVENLIVDQSKITNSTTNDYYVGAPFLQNLSGHVANMPKVGIVSAEDAPSSHWKTITNYTVNPVTDLPFNTTDDDDVEVGMKKVHNFYAGQVSWCRFWQANAFLPFIGRIWKWQGDNWQRGVNWIANSEAKYVNLIGNIELTPHVVPQSICPWPCTMSECVYGQSGCSIQPPYGTVYTVETFPTDGIVNTNAQALPGAIHNFNVQGANHAEERNHPGITQTFKQLMDGETGVPGEDIKFFKIPKL